MRMKEEQIRNVAKVFEAFARAIAKRENIKIETLDDFGEIYEIYIDMNKSNSLEFSFDSLGYISIRNNGDFSFTNITDITYRDDFQGNQAKIQRGKQKVIYFSVLKNLSK